MASAAVPIHEQLRVDSTFVASLSRSSILPAFIRKLLQLWLFPKLLKATNDILAGEALGCISKETAKSLYLPLSQLHLELNSILDERAPVIFRLVFGRWMESVRRENEVLGDIVEALAWGSEEDLRGIIDSTIAQLQDR